MTISTASIDDAAEILALQLLAYQSEAVRYPGIPIPPLSQTLDNLMAEFETQIILKAVSAGRIAGSVRARLEDGTCHVGRLVVHPDSRRQGIGSALMRAIESAAHTAMRFELFTGHLSADNLRLYTHLGYSELRRQPVCDGLTLIFMEKLAIAAGQS